MIFTSFEICQGTQNAGFKLKYADWITVVKLMEIKRLLSRESNPVEIDKGYSRFGT